MAVREIRTMGDEVLNKVCKEVTTMTPRTQILIEDMIDTMYEANGVGLAAPQVGVLKRIVVIDVGEGPMVLINPVILESSGEQTGDEGCLSVPGKAGQVTRPNYVKVKAFNDNMEEVIYEGEELLARAFCHELEHLDGHLYVEKVENLPGLLMLGEAYEAAKQTLVDNRSLLDEISEYLLVKETITGEELMSFIKASQQPPVEETEE